MVKHKAPATPATPQSDADHLFAGLEGLGDFAADGILHHGVGERGDDVLVNIGFEERSADIAHGVRDVLLGDIGLARELAVQAVERV